MPRVSQFFGIVIYFSTTTTTPPPHFHAKYQGADAAFDLATLSVVAGGLTPRALALVREWAALHGPELERAWEQCRRGEVPDAIQPLE